MIKLSQLQAGDIVRIEEEDGQQRTGTVSRVSKEDGMACVHNGVQEFWYAPEVLTPIPLTEDALINVLGFEREAMEDGSVKYKKGPFRVVVHDPGTHAHLDIWYREDRRHFTHPLYVHELQNQHLQMTKMVLEPGG